MNLLAGDAKVVVVLLYLQFFLRSGNSGTEILLSALATGSKAFCPAGTAYVFGQCLFFFPKE